MRIAALASEPASPSLCSPAGWLKAAVLLWRSGRLRWVRLRRSRRQGEPGFSLNYLGEGESLAYLTHTLFPGAEACPKAVVPFWEAPGLVGRRGRELWIVEVNRLLLERLFPGGPVSSPWVRQVVSLDGPAYRARKRQIEAVYGRRVRKQGYECRMTRAPGAVREFHAELCAPYLRARFPADLHLRSVAELEAAARGGFVLQVIERGEWVAGAVCRRTRSEVSALAFGLRPEFSDRLRRGALSAAYYFLFRWAEGEGLRAVDLLRSRANASDGVYEHKRRWGAEPGDDPWIHTRWWFHLPREIPLPPELSGQLVQTRRGFVGLADLLEEASRSSSTPEAALGSDGLLRADGHVVPRQPPGAQPADALERP